MEDCDTRCRPKYACEYHVVFNPKYHKKKMVSRLRLPILPSGVKAKCSKVA